MVINRFQLIFTRLFIHPAQSSLKIIYSNTFVAFIRGNLQFTIHAEYHHRGLTDMPRDTENTEEVAVDTEEGAHTMQVKRGTLLCTLLEQPD